MKKAELIQLIREEIRNITNELSMNPDSPEMVAFLDKVRAENPDMLAKFRSLAYNKGLEVAQDMYQEFDPEIIKQQKALASQERRRQTKRDWYGRNKDRIKAEKEAKLDRKIRYHINDFVSFLPDNFPEQWEKLNNSDRYGSNGRDGNYYMLIGAYINKYDLEFPPLETPGGYVGMGDLVQDAITSEKYEDYFEKLMYGKFGDEIEF